MTALGSLFHGFGIALQPLNLLTSTVGLIDGRAKLALSGQGPLNALTLLGTVETELSALVGLYVIPPVN